VPELLEETSSNNYFELNLTSLFRKLTEKKNAYSTLLERSES